MAREPSTKYFQYLEKSQLNLKSCGLSLIVHIHEMTKGKKELHEYMDEMLHSIFFLGYIYESRLTPEDFVTDSQLCRKLKKIFPGPFKSYNTHLPSRTPFSILLDIMERLYKTEEKVRNELQKLMEELKFPPPLHQLGNKHQHYYTLEATVICVCYSEPNSERYFGASLSCRKGNSKRIMIDVSCLNTWHEFVSHAVMSFTASGDTGDDLKFPDSVKCEAYIRDWKTHVYVKKDPCVKCKKLFNLQDADQCEVKHPYGNCAETECLSKLLTNNTHVQKNTKIINHAKDLTKQRLTDELKKVNFQINNEQFPFYRPT